MGKSLAGKELGTGITQRQDGLYQARFTNRFGKRQTIYGTTQAEIKKKLREAMLYDEKELNLADSSMTLNEWFDKWLKVCKAHCRDTTIRTYNIAYNRMRADLGWRKLSSLNLVILQDAFNKFATDNIRKHCKAVLVDILNYAVDANLLLKNPAFRINPFLTNEEKVEKRILSDEEIRLLLQVSRDRVIYPIFVVALFTGMRIGEIIGLTWDCVDFEHKTIAVKQTLCYLPNNGTAIYEFHSPKTTAGRRTVPMTEEVREALLAQKKRKDHISARYQPLEGLEDLVFCSRRNRPLHESNVRRSVNDIVDAINEMYPDFYFAPLTPHGFRHTFATKAIENGMRPKTLQKILGHKSLQMTMDLYCHVEEETLHREMQIIEKWCSSGVVNDPGQKKC